MSHFVSFWESLGDGKFLLLLLAVFFLLHVIFMIYKLLTLSVNKKQLGKESEEEVSVIITCSNKAELLSENLEAFLKQDYPCFEVIVVDECSEDETKHVLEHFQEKYPNLKTSRISPETKFRRTKKLAIHIGVLAAQYDILLFSEIWCRPASSHWIRSMQAAFSEKTAVVQGMANYSEEIKNNVKRFFRCMRFWQTGWRVRMGLCVAGDGCNMGYRKKYYLEERGFTKNTQEYIGYDTDMVKVLSKHGEVAMANGKDSLITIIEDDARAWKDDFSYYYATKQKWDRKAILGGYVDYVFEGCFYLLSLYFICMSEYWLYFLVPIVVVCVFNLIIINAGLKKLGQKKLFVSSLRNGVYGFIYKLYYYTYSVFARKKWR